MADSLIDVIVLKRKEHLLVLNLRIINPSEYYFYEKKNFALQLIWDATQVIDLPDCPLAKEISADEILDSQWVLDNQDRYIETLKIISVTNYPDKLQLAQMSRLDFDEFRKKRGDPEAIFEIHVTDIKWITHIKEGMHWESCSYDMEN